MPHPMLTRLLLPRLLLTAALIGLCAPAVAAPAPAFQAPALKPITVRDWAALPDWDGVWTLDGPTTFDPATAQPRGGVAGTPGVRERPPYKAEWEARYAANLALVNQGKFVDPVSTCGLPAGMPRMLNLKDGFEWVVRPDQVWQVSPNGGSVRRIYTDGRPHLPEDEIYATFTGDNIGRWEGDTLVVDTIALRDDTILDRTGLVHSEALHVVQRVRKTGPDTMEIQMTLEDSEALTRPWRVTKRYRRASGPGYVYDFACAENNPDPLGRDNRPNAGALPTGR